MGIRVQGRAKRVAGAFQDWLHISGSGVAEATERTASEQFFPMHDVDYGLRCFERQVTEDRLLSWLDEQQVNDTSQIIPRKILCLHAGNLPMVGLQDVLACLLLGQEYYGKISRKDPFLIPSFLEFWMKRHPDESAVWSTDLDRYRQLRAEAVLFSGSSETVPKVRRLLRQGAMVGDKTKYLIRTAHFSIAYLDRSDPAHLKSLAEAIARYEGRGCRSVAIVVSPVSLRSIQCHMTDFFEAFWTENPIAFEMSTRLRYRMAYNKAVGRPQAMLDAFLIEESDPGMDENVIYWVEGDTEKVRELADRFSDQLQNIY
ncbi:MAG TPA: hypothetical protein VKA08_04770, partial [Balneolales bacterium]|nr:hypothetical protein [Balneolales bacterium]